MSEHPLVAATRRVIAALDQLEQRLHQQAVSQDRDQVQEQQLQRYIYENEQLLHERENLVAAFTSLTHQYEDLQKVAQTIHGKLDESAKRITQILEG